MKVSRVDIEDYNNDRDSLVDDAIGEVMEEKNLSPRGEKTQATLNEEGRQVLNRHGATLGAAAQELAQILECSKDEDLKFKVSKFLVERHAGRLEGQKSDTGNVIVLNIGGEINQEEPNLFNPSPINVTPVGNNE